MNGNGLTSRNIDIHRYNSITPSHHRVAVMIIPPTVCATPHTDHPSRFRHLVVDLPQRRCHLVGECAGYNHHIGLPWGGAENDTEAVLIIPRRWAMHHFNRAACEAKGHRMEGAISNPIEESIGIWSWVNQLVRGCSQRAIIGCGLLSFAWNWESLTMCIARLLVLLLRLAVQLHVSVCP